MVGFQKSPTLALGRFRSLILLSVDFLAARGIPRYKYAMSITTRGLVRLPRPEVGYMHVRSNSKAWVSESNICMLCTGLAVTSKDTRIWSPRDGKSYIADVHTPRQLRASIFSQWYWPQHRQASARTIHFQLNK